MTDEQLITEVLTRLDMGNHFADDFDYHLERETGMVLENPELVRNLREFIDKAFEMSVRLDAEAWGSAALNEKTIKKVQACIDD